MEGKTIAPIEVKMGFKWQGLLLSVIVGMAIWLIPIPEGLSAKAWGMLLALFTIDTERPMVFAMAICIVVAVISYIGLVRGEPQAHN